MSDSPTNFSYQIAYVMQSCLWESQKALSRRLETGDSQCLDDLIKANQALKEISEACCHLKTAKLIDSESVGSELERLRLMINELGGTDG
jgi:hypothetical protein